MKKQIDWNALYTALESRREVENRSWRDIATELGLNSAVFTRLAQGKTTDVGTFVTLTTWLGLSPDSFVIGDKHSPSDSEETLAAIASFLRADSGLKPKSAEAIETVLRAAYAQLAEPPAEVE